MTFPFGVTGVLLLVGTIAVVLFGLYLWPSIREGLAEGVAVAKAERAGELEAETDPEEAAAMRAELEGFSPAERRGVLLGAPFREFLFNGPVLALRWTEATSVWLRTFRLPPDKAEGARKALAEEWDVTDPESLRERIDWLLTTGHRGAIDGIFDLAEPDADADALADLDAEGRKAVAIARAARERVGDAGGVAFDVARAAMLTVNGMALGDLSVAEGRSLLAACAEEAERRCDGWRQFGESFLAGGEIWMRLSGLAFAGVHQRWWRQTVDWLVDDPLSPWRDEPWGDGSDAGSARRAANARAEPRPGQTLH